MRDIKLLFDYGCTTLFLRCYKTFDHTMSLLFLLSLCIWPLVRCSEGVDSSTVPKPISESNYLLQSKSNGDAKEGKRFRFGSTSQLLLGGEPGGGVVKRDENASEEDIFKDILTLVANSIPNSGKCIMTQMMARIINVCSLF